MTFHGRLPTEDEAAGMVRMSIARRSDQVAVVARSPIGGRDIPSTYGCRRPAAEPESRLAEGGRQRRLGLDAGASVGHPALICAPTRRTLN